MHLVNLIPVLTAAILLVNAIPVPQPATRSIGPATQITEKRDGSTEFDTDLCILKKKRGDVLGIGFDNCDL